MKSFLSLLIIIGGLTAGWMNRDKLSDLWAKRSITSDESAPASDSSSTSSPHATATPNPARDAQAKALALYPGLAIPNSPVNQKFVALYKEAQANNSVLLTHSDWPLTFAERAVVSLGGAPLPRTAATASARSSKQVVIYTTSHCPYCKQAKDYLTKRGIPFREVDIEMSSAGEADFHRLGGNGVPLIIVGDKKMNGYNEKELERLLL